MAPKKATDRVVKSKAKPRQSAAAAQATGKADEELHLIYLCLKSNGGGQVSVPELEQPHEHSLDKPISLCCSHISFR